MILIITITTMMFYQVTTIFIEKKQRNRAIFKRIMNQPQIVLSRWVFSLHCRNQRIMPHTNTSTVNYTFSIHLFFKTFEYFKNILNCANSMDEKWNEHWRYSCLKRYAFQSICYETSVKRYSNWLRIFGWIWMFHSAAFMLWIQK